ncbi:MAG: YqcI/YcgG family protein [Dermatophilaceae bacterium]
MVQHPEYPCLGAKSVFRREGARVVVLDDMTDASEGGSLARLGAELTAYGQSVDSAGDFASFIAVFRGPLP